MPRRKKQSSEAAELCLMGRPRDNGGQQLATDDVLWNDSAPLTPDWRRCQEPRRCVGPSRIDDAHRVSSSARLYLVAGAGFEPTTFGL